MRVLMSLPDRRVRGGPPSHLYLLRDSLRDLGVDVRSFVYGARTSDENWLRKVAERLLDLIRLPFLCARHRPHIVQLNSAFDERAVLRDVFFVPLTRLLGQTVIVKFHGSSLTLLARNEYFWRLATWIVVRCANTICLLSHQEKAAFTERFSRSHFVVVKNALDLSRYRTTREFRSQYNIGANKKLLLFIGRFISSKGLREVILALPKVRERHDVHAVLVGDGPARSENEALCAQLQLEEATTFTGYIPEEETVPAYLAADLLVFPTYHQEGMPMVIFHSLACGLPVVTTRIRAAADWLEDGKHCVFVPARDPDKLAETVITLLDLPDRRAMMGRCGRELAKQFESSLVAGEFCALYSSIVNGMSSRGRERDDPK